MTSMTIEPPPTAATTTNNKPSSDIEMNPAINKDTSTTLLSAPEPSGTMSGTPTPQPPPPQPLPPISTPSSNSQLASMLADAMSDIESLKSSLEAERKRAAYFESLSSSLQSVRGTSTSPTASSAQTEAITKIAELEKRAYDAEVRRDQEIAKRLALADQWKALSRYFDRLDGCSKDARVRMDRMVEGLDSSSRDLGGDAFVTLHVPTVDELQHEERVYYEGKNSRRRRRSGSLERMESHHPQKRSRSDRHGGYHQYIIDASHFEPERAHLPHHLYVPPGVSVSSTSPNSPYATHPPPHHPSQPLPPAQQGHHHHHHHHHHNQPQGVPHPQQVPGPIPSPNTANATAVPHLRHPHGPKHGHHHSSAHLHGGHNHGRHSRSHSQSRREGRSPSPGLQAAGGASARSRSDSRDSSGSLDEMLLATTGSPDHPNANPQVPNGLAAHSSSAGLRPPSQGGRERSHSRPGPESLGPGHMLPPPPLLHPQHPHSSHPQQFSHPLPPGPGAGLVSPISGHPSAGSPPGSGSVGSARYPSDSPPISRRERERERERAAGTGTLVPDGSLEFRDRDGRPHSSHSLSAHEREYRERDREREARDVRVIERGGIERGVGERDIRDRDRGVDRDRDRDGRQYEYHTHTFAPVQTGAPVRRSKYNTEEGVPHGLSLASLTAHPTLNASSASFSSANSLASAINSSSMPIGSPSSHLASSPSAMSPFPATNASGQRICRQCGQPGRYKDGKCVEKWGPGPMGPGTVCDRCRKKMKRVERRAQQQGANAGETQRPNQAAKTIPRTDTMLIGPGQGQGQSQSYDSVRGSVSTNSKLGLPFPPGSAKAASAAGGSKAASRAGSIVNGATGTPNRSRKASPARSGTGAITPARMVQPGPSALGRKPLNANGNGNGNGHQSNGSSGSRGSMDIDADGEADEDLDEETQPADPDVEGELVQLAEGRSPYREGRRGYVKVNKEEEVDGELAEMLGDGDDDREDEISPERYGDRERHAARKYEIELDVDEAVSQLAGMDDSPRSGDASGELDVEGDAELDLLEAVDAAEANSVGSSA